MRFAHPENLNRIKLCYPDVDTDHLMLYLRAFARKAKSMSEFKHHDIMHVLDPDFLAKDSSALQFDQTHSVVQYTPDTKKIVKHFYELYFPPHLWKSPA